MRPIGLSTLSLCLLAACGGEPQDLGAAADPLTARCAATRSDVAADAFVCGDARTVECASPTGTPVDAITVIEAEAPTARMLCGSGDTLEISDPGPYDLGTHQISVTRVDSAGFRSRLCTSELTVVDATAPEVTSATVALWPPNHKWHRIRAEDCVTVTDACDAAPRVEFLWATSDEPVNGRGDGNTDPDIRNLGCGSVELRAERSGRRNGRVYRLGVRVIDRSGNATDAECVVGVAHDQRGVAAIADAPMGEAVLAPEACGETGGGSGGAGGVDPGHGGTGGGEGPLPPGGV